MIVTFYIQLYMSNLVSYLLKLYFLFLKNAKNYSLIIFYFFSFHYLACIYK